MASTTSSGSLGSTIRDDSITGDVRNFLVLDFVQKDLMFEPGLST
jgi:hypothetical protein